MFWLSDDDARERLEHAAIDGAALAVLMVSACAFAVLLGHPESPARLVFGPVMRRALTGLGMGATLVAIVYSRWGRRSGAHMNPALTLTFLRLGKISRADAVAYVAAQFIGGAVGVVIARALIGASLMNAAVRYAVTEPGPWGLAAAFGAEVLISALMMALILVVSSRESTRRFTGVCAGLLVATYITFESPVSGMSMNPARTLGSALAAHRFGSLWIYFTAPVIGMLLAGQLVRSRTPLRACAKLAHPAEGRCRFCEWEKARASERRA